MNQKGLIRGSSAGDPRFDPTALWETFAVAANRMTPADVHSLYRIGSDGPKMWKPEMGRGRSAQLIARLPGGCSGQSTDWVASLRN
jgi:hypothetical protein